MSESCQDVFELLILIINQESLRFLIFTKVPFSWNFMNFNIFSSYVILIMIESSRWLAVRNAVQISLHISNSVCHLCVSKSI